MGGGGLRGKGRLEGGISEKAEVAFAYKVFWTLIMFHFAWN